MHALDVEHFRERGYVVAKQVLAPSDFDAMKADIAALVEAQARRWADAGHLPPELLDGLLKHPFAVRLARVVEALRAHGGDGTAVDDEIERFGLALDTMYARTRATFDFFFTPRLLDAIASLIGDEITLSPIQHLRPMLPARRVGGEILQAAVGAATLSPWHQDMGVTREEADGTDIVTCWIPLVAATAAMGALKVIPDLHDPERGKGEGLLEHVKHPEYGTTIRADLVEAHIARAVDCPCELGDVLLMHHFTPHRTGGANVDARGRVRWSLDVRFQRRDTPTGRPFWPELVVRSVAEPSAEQRDYDEWCARWERDLASSAGERWHRVAGDVGGSIGRARKLEPVGAGDGAL